jgi:hypothetical protein
VLRDTIKGTPVEQEQRVRKCERGVKNCASIKLVFVIPNILELLNDISIRYLHLNNEWTSVIPSKALARTSRFPVAHITGVPVWYFVKVKAIPAQDWTGSAFSRSLRRSDFKKTVPAAFTPQEIFMVLIFIGAWVGVVVKALSY